MSNCQKNNNVKHKDYQSDNLHTWCTNCGNYGIHSAMIRALVEECILPKDSLLVFDIGCNGNGSDKINGYRFHGIHGRSIPFASGAAMANRNITVIASSGDGAVMGEGIGHLVHAIRSNYNMTFVLHNNSNFALTTGQASPTTDAKSARKGSPDGTGLIPMNPSEFVLGLNPSFVARGYSGEIKQLTEIIRQGIQHNGFSFIEVLQDCPSYNDVQTHDWYRDRVKDVKLMPGYDISDITKSKKLATELEKEIATGVLYQNKDIQTYYDNQDNRQEISTELVDEVKNYNIDDFLKKNI